MGSSSHITTRFTGFPFGNWHKNLSFIKNIGAIIIAPIVR